jgi:hypothetical protein
MLRRLQTGLATGPNPQHRRPFEVRQTWILLNKLKGLLERQPGVSAQRCFTTLGDASESHGFPPFGAFLSTETFMTSRREFVIQLSLGGTALLAGGQAMAQSMLAESDAQAAALGYKADTTKVDGKKYANHKNDQRCDNCALFAGKVGDKAGGCPLFAGKQVAGPGWCSAWAKKG